MLIAKNNDTDNNYEDCVIYSILVNMWLKAIKREIKAASTYAKINVNKIRINNAKIDDK